jgi:hypothetical protein
VRGGELLRRGGGEGDGGLGDGGGGLGDGGLGGGGLGDGGGGEGDVASTAPRSTGTHCGWTATGRLAPASSLAKLDPVMGRRFAPRQRLLTPMRMRNTSRRKLEVLFFVCRI